LSESVNLFVPASETDRKANIFALFRNNGK